MGPMVRFVHHVEVDHVRPGGQYVVALFAKTGKVGGEDRGGDQVILLGHEYSSV